MAFYKLTSSDISIMKKEAGYREQNILKNKGLTVIDRFGNITIFKKGVNPKKPYGVNDSLTFSKRNRTFIG